LATVCLGQLVVRLPALHSRIWPGSAGHAPATWGRQSGKLRRVWRIHVPLVIPAIVFLILQRRFVSALLQGSLKG
jgi:hypothetical protein